MAKNGTMTAAAAADMLEMTGPDTRMDEAANPLPIKCPHCTLPDLDFVAKPYLLVRGFDSPAQTAPAEVGNFLVRERVKKILDLVAPGACTFVPTAQKKSNKPTDWFLAVPNHVVDLPGGRDRSDGKERCSKCGEPMLGTYFEPQKQIHDSLAQSECAGLDVFKSKQWMATDTLENFYANALKYTPKGEPPPPWENFGKRRGIAAPTHPQRWSRVNLDRDLFFSVRLEQLLKKAKVKGQLVRKYNFEHVEPSADHLEWIDAKLRALADAGLADTAPAASGASKKKPAGDGRKWFNAFVKKNAAKKKPASFDFAALEKKQKVNLPADYKSFISTVGPKSFEDVNATEGFTAKVVAPKKLDFKSYRRGKWKKMNVDSDVDGVMFADTDHGDVFVFDVAGNTAANENDFPVYWLDHEQNTLEAFAPNFAACVKRFHERT